MSVAVAAGRAAPAAAPVELEGVIARHVFGSAVRWAIVWGIVFGLFVISTVVAYHTAYPTAAERVRAAATLQSFAIILGQPYHAETLAGFTVWRVTVVIALIGAVWALLTSTGLLRGDEDDGRWELLLAGPVTKLRAAAETLAAFGGSLGVMFGLTLVVTLIAGGLPGANFGVAESVLFAITLVCGAAMWLAIGSLASQLAATRGQAMTIGGGILAVSFLIRMIADASRGLGWMRWLSPFGWIEEIHPLRGMNILALVPIAALIAICVAATLVIAKDRDLGASVLREREGGGSGGDLRGPTTLGLRLVRRVAGAWIVQQLAFGFFTGFSARSAASLLANSPQFAQVLGRLGIRQASEGYLGFTFLFVSVFLSVIAATQLAQIRDEEASGRLDNLIVRPTQRLVWLGGRVALVVALILMCGLASGFGTWLGAESQHAGVSLSKLLEAGLNATVPALFVIGAGVLTFALRPRLTSAVSYGLVAYSFLINLVGSLIKGQDWIRDSSIYSHIKLAPAAKPDWGESSVILLIAVAAVAVAAGVFQRRDIEYA